jgi:hypothetical protein
MPRRKLTEMTKPERLNFIYGADALEMIERDILDVMWAQRGCPPDWHEISTDKDRRDARRTR